MSKIRFKRKWEADIRQKVLILNQRVSSVMCQVGELMNFVNLEYSPLHFLNENISPPSVHTIIDISDDSDCEEIIKTIESPKVGSNSHDVAGTVTSSSDNDEPLEIVDPSSSLSTNTEVISQIDDTASKENEVSEEFSHTKICNDSSPKTQESLLQERILPNFKGRTNINVGQSFQSYNTYPSVF